MANFTTYKGLKILAKTPDGDGGKALNDNFSEIANRTGPNKLDAIIDPSSSDHAPDYYPGSIWLNVNSGNSFICTESNTSSATWEILGSGGSGSVGSLNRFSFSPIDATTETVDAFNYSIEGAEAVTWEYIVQDGTNYRAGRVQAVWNSIASNITFYETTTNDIGDTSGVTIVVDHDSGLIRLRVTTTSNGWSIKGTRLLLT